MLLSSSDTPSSKAIPLSQWEDDNTIAVFQNSQNQHNKYNTKTDRTPPLSAKTDLQLELFATVPDYYQYVENLLSQLPRQRQREHFRKLYLREYHSISDDGSIAFSCGNKQTKHANLVLRDVISNRLRKVFKQYRCDVSFLQCFEQEPAKFAELTLSAQLALCKVTVPTREEIAIEKEELATLPAYFHHYSKIERQKASLPFYLLTETKLKEIAYKLASLFAEQQQHYIYQLAKENRTFTPVQLADITLSIYKKCGQNCENIGFPIPHWAKFLAKKKIKGEQLDIALSKITCEKYWFRIMRKTQKQMIEHIAIACGEVSKKTHSYISADGFRNHLNNVKKNFDFLKAMIVENIDNPEEQAELFDMYLRSSSNPAIRRNEMMARLNGLEAWAEESEHQALFLTLTAPSAYHATLHNGQNNPKWNGASPKETQVYLNNVWKQFRALLAKRDIKFYGMRVAEPHHDGTPHWHLLVYIKAKDRDEFVRLFKLKALEIDGNEKGAKKHRSKVEDCDPKKGSATGYIIKYIVKNLDGYAKDGEMSDEMPNLSLKDNAKLANAWASLWNIRQFQFYGGASISVWRELRRLVAGQIDNDKIEDMRICADMGCYASYMKRQGGALAKRTEQQVKLHYEQLEPNQYGEKRKKIDGIQAVNNPLETIKTRNKKWAIKKKRKTEQTNAVQSTAQIATSGRLGLVSVTVTREEMEERIKNALIPISLPLNEYQIDYLLNNGKLILNKYQSIKIKNDEVLINTDQTSRIRFADEPDYLEKLRNLIN